MPLTSSSREGPILGLSLVSVATTEVVLMEAI
jgi:hypothetical protein